MDEETQNWKKAFYIPNDYITNQYYDSNNKSLLISNAILVFSFLLDKIDFLDFFCFAISSSHFMNVFNSGDDSLPN